MKRLTPKEVFIIHTKSVTLDRNIVDSLAKLLLTHGFTIWGYSDWDWNKEMQKEQTWEDQFKKYGFLDMEKELESLTGGRPSVPPSVDYDTLDKILLRTRAVIFLNPTKGKLTDGMREELWSLRRFHEDRLFPKPILLWCTIEADDWAPPSLDSFGSGDLICSNKFRIEVQDDDINVKFLMTIMVALSGFLLNQRVAFVRKLVTEQIHNFILSDFYCSPDEELSRASRVLESVQQYINVAKPYEPLLYNAEFLNGLTQQYISSDLDWSKIRQTPNDLSMG
jgi:hypothetical protein